jgi:hypothetical protein
LARSALLGRNRWLKASNTLDGFIEMVGYVVIVAQGSSIAGLDRLGTLLRRGILESFLL